MTNTEASMADTNAAMASHEAFTSLSKQFVILCSAGHWEDASKIRERAIYHLTAYYDHMATAHALLRLEHGLPWRHSRKR